MDLLSSIAEANRSRDMAQREVGNSRELALVRTKLDEAHMWAGRAAAAAVEIHPVEHVAAVFGDAPNE